MGHLCTSKRRLIFEAPQRLLPDLDSGPFHFLFYTTPGALRFVLQKDSPHCHGPAVTMDNFQCDFNSNTSRRWTGTSQEDKVERQIRQIVLFLAMGFKCCATCYLRWYYGLSMQPKIGFERRWVTIFGLCSNRSVFILLSVNVSPSTAEELALSLSEALSSGDEQEAAALSRRLSQLSVPVTVTVNSQAYPQASIRWGQITHFFKNLHMSVPS